MSHYSKKPVHPGAFIRANVIPSGMSVTQAAKRLGVGRPALSRLLNAKSSLSPSMAVRLEKAFGANRQQLLDSQVAFDRYSRRGAENSIPIGAYVPDYCGIRASRIQAWAEQNSDARHTLAVILRKLVHSTGERLRKVDFPGYDNAQRKGWDGVIETDVATPWIPEGRSLWEFSVRRDPSGKAESDFAKRSRIISLDDRAHSTFVFVTARNWQGKTKWADRKRAGHGWKDVRAYDADDLEQWLEQSVPAQIWFAERLGLPVNELETLEGHWRQWSMASDPVLTDEIFESSTAAYGAVLTDWLGRDCERPLVVAADSAGEGLAFLACLFRDPAVAERSRDLPVVFESAGPLRQLAASRSPFIPVVHSEAAERELATVYRERHCIVVRTRNAIDSQPDINLNVLDHRGFTKALSAMGIDRDEANRLARASGRSPTILRRRLSKIPAIQEPEWARDAENARDLIPMALTGAWHASSKADREAIVFLAEKDHARFEQDVERLRRLKDPPVWSAGQYRGVTSKVDALFAIHRWIQQGQLDRFFVLAEHVLSEAEPALDLPEDRRWTAGLYRKLRNHSSALRKGICETLVILSTYGGDLVAERLGIDVEARVSALVRKLLTPLSLKRLLSHDRDLPKYAEAAPHAILQMLEQDLQQPEPVVLGLLKPAGDGPFGSCPRAGLLWALECLAWKHIERASWILAQLSRSPIHDNWGNRPIASLAAIYRSWVPQTAAPLEARMKSLEQLTQRLPDIGWTICMEQLKSGHKIGHFSYRPLWRGDASGAGQPITRGESRAFTRKAVDLALAWPAHDQRTLGDLVERLDSLGAADQVRIWDLVDKWSESNASEAARAALRERIRVSALPERDRQRRLTGLARDRVRTTYAKLQPRDVVVRHAWLFASRWIRLPNDGVEDGDTDPLQQEARIGELRVVAIKEIWEQRGFEGLTALLAATATPDTAGRALAVHLARPKDQIRFLRQCLSATGDLARNIDLCMKGFLAAIGLSPNGSVLAEVAASVDSDEVVRLFQSAPFGQQTWEMLGAHGNEVQARYWKDVVPSWHGLSDPELVEVVDQLLEADRPRAAFCAVHLDWSRVETSRLKRLLRAVVTSQEEPAGHYYRIDGRDISDALDSLEGRDGSSPAEMVELAFLLLQTPDGSGHGIPYLQRQAGRFPVLFFRAVAMAFRRRQRGQDPPQLHIDDPALRAQTALSARFLLDEVRLEPGVGPDGKTDTEEFLARVKEVRRLCADHDRVAAGDQCIGEALARASAGDDGMWPSNAVCQVMEALASDDIGAGFFSGSVKGRTARWSGEAGAQDSELSVKYRNLAQQRGLDYPYVGHVLEGIANSYEREAKRRASEVAVEERLPD